MNTTESHQGTFGDVYREAILALDLAPHEAARFLSNDDQELVKKALEKRLGKVKLWHYAPDQREAVKTARTYLQNLLKSQAA
jgi:hypothetical protein